MQVVTLIGLYHKPRRADPKPTKPGHSMVKITIQPTKHKASELADADLDEYNNSAESQAVDSESDGTANDRAENLPTLPRPRKRRKKAVLTKRKEGKAAGKAKKLVPAVEADDESEGSEDEVETQNKSELSAPDLNE
jgi:hypothetical protein